MAEQISNLAQAQSILVEILVRLSATDKEVAELVQTCMEDIRRLQENDIYLLQNIQRLEDTCILGIRKTEDVKDLADREKYILSGCMRYLIALYSEVSGEQQQYANNLLNYLGVEAEIENISAALSQLDELARYKMLRCVMEYMFLSGMDVTTTQEQEEFIEEFNIGVKKIRELRKQISDTYRLRGTDGFIDKYKQSDSENDFFYFELDDEDAVGQDDMTGVNIGGEEKLGGVITSVAGQVEISDQLAGDIFDKIFIEDLGENSTREILAETDHYFVLKETMSQFVDRNVQRSYYFKSLNKTRLAIEELPDLSDFSIGNRSLGWSGGRESPISYVRGDHIYIQDVTDENHPSISVLSLTTK